MTPQIHRTGSAKPTRFRDRYGPWAVVTGASSGIGREIALRLGESGIGVVLIARKTAGLELLCRELSDQHGTANLAVAADLSLADAIETIERATSGLDVGLLVCAAGFGSSGPFINSAIDDELAMIDVNCRSLAALSWHFARRFKDRGRGGIILLSSLLAFQGVPRAANYAATKAYVQSLAEGLHHELRPLGVSVLASAPGPVHTGFAARARMTMGFAQRPVDVAQATLDALGRRSTIRPGWLSKALELSLKPLPRWGRVRMLGTIMSGMAKRAV